MRCNNAAHPRSPWWGLALATHWVTFMCKWLFTAQGVVVHWCTRSVHVYHTCLYIAYIVRTYMYIQHTSNGRTCTCGIWDANVHFSVKASKPAQSWVNAVGSVGGSHHYDMGPLLQPVHESQQLRHDATLHLTVSLEGTKGQIVEPFINMVTLHIHVHVQTLSLFGAMASSSSMKIIAGAFFSASSKAIQHTIIGMALYMYTYLIHIHTQCTHNYNCTVYIHVGRHNPAWSDDQSPGPHTGTKGEPLLSTSSACTTHCWHSRIPAGTCNTEELAQTRLGKHNSVEVKGGIDMNDTMYLHVLLHCMIHTSWY